MFWTIWSFNYSLSSCPHTYCFSGLTQLKSKKCLTCNIPFKEKNPNIDLLEFIPESVYGKSKAESLKALIDIKGAKQDITGNRQKKLTHHQMKLTLL